MKSQMKQAVDEFLSLPTDHQANGEAEEKDWVPTTVRDVHKAYTRALQETFIEYGIGIGQWFFLKALWEEDGVTQRQLSQRVGTMEPATVAALNCLEERNLVRRVRNQQDRRKVNIYLTEQGQELREVLLPRAADIHKQALAGLTEADLQETLLVLRRIGENLRVRAFGEQWDILDGGI